MNTATITGALTVILTAAILAPAWAATPLDVSGCRVWLDGQDIDGAGSEEGLGEGGLDGTSHVQTWVDKSLSGNDVTQGTQIERPLYTQNGLGNKFTLSFDGVDDSLSDSFNSGIVTGYTGFIVFRTKAPPSVMGTGYSPGGTTTRSPRCSFGNSTAMKVSFTKSSTSAAI